MLCATKAGFRRELGQSRIHIPSVGVNDLNDVVNQVVMRENLIGRCHARGEDDFRGCVGDTDWVVGAEEGEFVLGLSRGSLRDEVSIITCHGNEECLGRGLLDLITEGPYDLNYEDVITVVIDQAAEMGGGAVQAVVGAAYTDFGEPRECLPFFHRVVPEHWAHQVLGDDE